MNKHKASANTEQHKPSRREMKEKRIDDLLDSCRDQVLQQIIGPFGLTPAMFNDKDGGSVTTQHNAEKDIFAKPEEEYNRKDYNYDSAKTEIKKSAVIDGVMNSNEFTDAYTGIKEPTKRVNQAGKLVMNAELDHLIPLKEIHKSGSWMQSKEERKETSSEKDNLHYTAHKYNRTKSDKNPNEFLSEANGFDQDRVKPMIEKAQVAIDGHQPSTADRVMYQGSELLSTGAKDAAKNALRQATGMVLHELVSGSYVEIRRLTKEPSLQEEFVDHLIQAIKNVATRIQGKLEKIFEAIVSGGIQGFVSNLLTYIINCIWTTAAKLVTVIREGMKELWEAIKLMSNPPAGMSGMEVAQAVTKIIAGVVTLYLGIAFEESVKTFILSIPLLAPFADTIAPALTAILTGIVSALVIFGIDRIFDWLNNNGTEILEAQIVNLEASITVFEKMTLMISAQFRNSENYQICIKQYAGIEANLVRSAASLDWAIHHAEVSISSLTETIKTCEEQFPIFKQMDQELHELLDNYQLENKGSTHV